MLPENETITGFKAAMVNDSVYNVLDEGAVTGDTDANAVVNAQAFASAVSKAQATGGTVYFPRGTYRTNQSIIIYPGVSYVGDGGTRLKLASAANVDLMKTVDFDSLYSDSTNAGPDHFILRDLILDGHRAAQTATSHVLSIYGSNFRIENVDIVEGYSGGVRSKWGWGGTNMESQWTNVKIYNNQNQQFDWQGPHDSQFTNIIVFTDYAFHAGQAIAGSRAIKIHGNTAGGEQFAGLHIWGYHEIGFHVANNSNGDVKVFNGTSEGAQINVWLDNDLCIWDGTVYCTNGVGPYAGTEVGIRVGTEPGATRWMNRVRGTVWNHAAGDRPIYLAGDDGNDIDCNVRTDNATAAIFYRSGVQGPSYRSRVNIICPDNRQHAVSTQGFGGPGAPPGELGIVGSYYHRWDGTTGSRIYHKTAANTWVAIL